MNTIIYASVACSQEFFENHFNESGALPGQEVQKYNRLIIEGLAKNQVLLTVGFVRNQSEIFVR